MASPQEGNPKDIRDYLNAGGIGYLNNINGISEDSLDKSTKELGYLPLYLPAPRRILSVGVGQGEELHSLSRLFPNSRIIGMDISDLALHEAQRRTSAYKIDSGLVLADASGLPFQDASLSGVVFSSLLHEIYSYSPNGHTAWRKTICEAGRVLEPGGSLVIRDPAAPSFQDPVQIQFKTNLSSDFYNYFRDEYRRFKSWGPDSRDIFASKGKAEVKHLPQADKERTVALSPRYSAEVLFHFFNFWKGHVNNQAEIGDIHWKEINESYYLPSEDQIQVALPLAEYVSKIENVAKGALEGLGFKLRHVGHGISVRPKMREVLLEHFDIKLGQGQDYKDLAESEDPFTKKMELVFTKDTITDSSAKRSQSKLNTF